MSRRRPKPTSQRRFNRGRGARRSGYRYPQWAHGAERHLGHVVAHSLNGPIDVVMDRVDPSKPLSFSSLNGPIDVTLPADSRPTSSSRPCAPTSTAISKSPSVDPYRWRRTAPAGSNFACASTTTSKASSTAAAWRPAFTLSTELFIYGRRSRQDQLKPHLSNYISCKTNLDSKTPWRLPACREERLQGGHQKGV